MKNYIAIDIGASSGRLLHAQLYGEQLALKEIHRFANSFHHRHGHDYWDVDHIFAEIVKGLQKAKRLGIESCYLGLDTWAVDYVLLDQKGDRLEEVYAYRDKRTEGAPEKFHAKISREEVYARTGIQELPFNTLYQLYVHDRNQLCEADKIMLVPDYLYYRLSGRKVNEVTNASTMQMLNLRTREFDEELLKLLSLRRDQFSELIEPGQSLGMIRPELARQYDLPLCELVVVPTHDTASAVVSIPVQEGQSWAYISSGTWSLLGAEVAEPINHRAAMEANYTNEWGAFGTYRFLKNIMGLWMIQEVRRESDNAYSFSELAELAAAEIPFLSLIPCNDSRFLNPKSMIAEIQSFCKETRQPVPLQMGEITRCVFDSLALTYFDALRELEGLLGRAVEVLHIVGGGSNNELLCQLTANVIGKTVQAGPSEATALGNIAVQMISSQEVESIRAARELITRSFSLKVFEPEPICNLDQVLERWEKLVSHS
ncbi:rhamnulokinase [Paenibacillus lentus]|uniref:Rhamnulokinase n=1 Tax=Paenibacillus lentus TaxID=1338368 RepID=A0A3S8RX66_9BACL|nr:rhamnulokinase [Paenibacillus lentus]AZK47661.1 rhamnulokinase [Paenibacillus lentus]